MTTDLERLKAWMELNGYSTLGLSAALGYKRDTIKTFAGDNDMSFGFYSRFAYRFGIETFGEIFGRHGYGERLMAQIAVANAIGEGKLPPVKDFQCRGCFKQAQHYHHPSYRPSDYLNVVPLCAKCHYLAHRGKLDINFGGVVPTRVGLVRIAIATPLP